MSGPVFKLILENYYPILIELRTDVFEDLIYIERNGTVQDQPLLAAVLSGIDVDVNGGTSGEGKEEYIDV